MTAGLLTEDALLGGRLRLRQPAEGFRAAIDPVLLAAATPAGAGQRVLDLGCGVGTAGLALLTRVPEARVVGLEIDPELVAIAGENAVLNGLAERFEARQGDVGSPGPFPPVDHVLCNPPHLEAARGRASPQDRRRRAMQESDAVLEHWIEAALAALRPKGSVTLVHRADRLEAILAALHGRAGEIAVLPLWPAPPGAEPARPAKRVILRARKGLRSPTRLLPGLVLHTADGAYTAEAEAVLRGGRVLSL